MTPERPSPDLVQALPLSLESLRAYASRDFASVVRLKRRHWIERKRRLGAAEGIRVADELRRQVVALHPGRPTPEARESDLASHARVAELLRRAGYTGPR